MNSLALTWHGYVVSANVSLLFTEVPYLDRFAAAARAGFTAVETWWPFPGAAPSQREKQELLDALDEAGVALTGMNVFAGDMAAGDRGIACHPDRAAELESSLEVLHWIAERTGCRGFNLLHGKVPEGDARIVHDTAVQAYRRAAEVLGDLPDSPGVILVEPLARGLNGTYPLERAQDALDLIDEVGASTLKLLLDTFHLGRNGEDLPTVVAGAGDRIGHVQLADAPERGEPGSGTVDFAALGDALRAAGYTGSVAAEYRPTGETLSTLGWLSDPMAEMPLA